MSGLNDPCDGWSYSPRWSTKAIYRADRPEPVTFEGFDHRTVAATPILGKFLPFVRTDYAHWSYDTEWTLESGPDDAPSSLDILVPYNYRGGTSWSWTSYGGEPGDPAEVETGTAMYLNAHGEWCEVNLTTEEAERIELHIYENPPEPDYRDDY